MIKKSKPVNLILICCLVIAIVSLACNLPRGDSRNLTLEERAEDGSVSGKYHGTDGERINFKVTADGFATFGAEDASAEETVAVFFGDNGIANMTWGGYTFDGLGILRDEEQAVLENLMNSDLANGMAMIPLDIACLGDDAIDPRQLAALVFPLQMYFKYLVSDRGSEAERLMDLSGCDYGSQTENVPQILFAPSIPVPVVFGYFPFDEEGSLEEPISLNPENQTACLDFPPMMPVSGFDALSPLAENEGPCNAMCRGACGVDCARSNCDLRKEVRCEKDEAGNNTGMEVSYQIYDCGMHQGCIDHDACYDACNAELGCGTWYAAFCRHADPLGCDQAAIKDHGYQNTSAWAYGYGPQPLRATFEYEETWTKKLSLYKCPSEEIINATPKIEIIIPTEKSIGALADLTDEELCKLTPVHGSPSPGPINDVWFSWSDSIPVENAIATCVSYWYLEYTGQFNDMVIFLFASETEAQDRYEIERSVNDLWYDQWYDQMLPSDGSSSSVALGDEAWQWSVAGVETRVVARMGPFLLYGRADNLGPDQCDRDGDGRLESCEVYEAVALRLAETIANIDILLARGEN